MSQTLFRALASNSCKVMSTEKYGSTTLTNPVKKTPQSPVAQSEEEKKAMETSLEYLKEDVTAWSDTLKMITSDPNKFVDAFQTLNKLVGGPLKNKEIYKGVHDLKNALNGQNADELAKCMSWLGKLFKILNYIDAIKSFFVLTDGKKHSKEEIKKAQDTLSGFMADETLALIPGVNVLVSIPIVGPALKAGGRKIGDFVGPEMDTFAAWWMTGGAQRDLDKAIDYVGRGVIRYVKDQVKNRIDLINWIRREIKEAATSPNLNIGTAPTYVPFSPKNRVPSQAEIEKQLLDMSKSQTCTVSDLASEAQTFVKKSN